jgi:hypothetical protein
MRSDIHAARAPASHIAHRHVQIAQSLAAGYQIGASAVRVDMRRVDEVGLPKIERGDRVTQPPTADDSDMHVWTPAKRFDDSAFSCCDRPHPCLPSDPDSFALRQRAGRIGPVPLAEIVVGSDVSMVCGM